jgi:hypothetical protein
VPWTSRRLGNLKAYALIPGTQGVRLIFNALAPGVTTEVSYSLVGALALGAPRSPCWPSVGETCLRAIKPGHNDAWEVMFCLSL